MEEVRRWYVGGKHGATRWRNLKRIAETYTKGNVSRIINDMWDHTFNLDPETGEVLGSLPSRYPFAESFMPLDSQVAERKARDLNAGSGSPESRRWYVGGRSGAVRWRNLKKIAAMYTRGNVSRIINDMWNRTFYLDEDTGEPMRPLPARYPFADRSGDSRHVF